MCVQIHDMSIAFKSLQLGYWYCSWWTMTDPDFLQCTSWECRAHLVSRSVPCSWINCSYTIIFQHLGLWLLPNDLHGDWWLQVASRDEAFYAPCTQLNSFIIVVQKRLWTLKTSPWALVHNISDRQFASLTDLDHFHHLINQTSDHRRHINSCWSSSEHSDSLQSFPCRSRFPGRLCLHSAPSSFTSRINDQLGLFCRTHR